MPIDDDQMEKDARDHAWNYFAIHASQRMQTFNFFLVATAFLIAAYASLVEKHPIPAFVTAVVGAWVSYWFHRLDARTRQLIKASERALKIMQMRLANRTNVNEMKILETVEKAGYGASTYKVVIAVIQWTIVAVFISAALYAICRAGLVDALVSSSN
jgi:hypothetical protein